jgi:hypothetical protein
MVWQPNDTSIIKYADDTAIIGLISDDNDRDYQNCISYVLAWCKENFLEINVTKTKEIVWDFRRKSYIYPQLEIDNRCVDRVNCYKYLGVWIDEKLNFNKHVDEQLKKANKRVYCLRKLCKLSVEHEIIVRFYNATIAPLLMYASTSFFGLLTKECIHMLGKPQRICKKLVEDKCMTLVDVNEQLYYSKLATSAKHIVLDPSHPLNKYFELLPSGRRYRAPKIRTSRYKKTFVPQATNFLNKGTLVNCHL